MDPIKKIELWALGTKIGTAIEEGNRMSLDLASPAFATFSPLQFEQSKMISSIGSVHEIGLIGDALPGAYGINFLNKYFQDEFCRKPSNIDMLAFIGSHGLGAIEFRPPSDTGRIDSELIATLEELKTQSREVYEGEHTLDIAKLIAISNSAAGGARSKAVVGFNPDTNRIHIGQKHAAPPDGFKKCIVKFNAKKGSAIDEYNNKIRAEYLYYKIASGLGINMTDCWLIEEDGICHFATERFDVDTSGERLHMHSFAGLIGSDASSFSTSYESLFRVANRLSISNQDKEQVFKTMAFNLVFGNKDDHARNFSFLMDQNMSWHFSPAYDLTFSTHNYGANKHQLKLGNGFADSAKNKAVMNAAAILGIANPKSIFDEFIQYKHDNLNWMAREVGLADVFTQTVFNETAQIDINLGGASKIFASEVSNDEDGTAHAIRR